MSLFVLDTDHISLIQRGHSQVVEHLGAKLGSEVVASIISFEEQLRGRLAIVRRASSPDEMAMAYLRLREMQDFFVQFPCLTLTQMRLWFTRSCERIIVAWARWICELPLRLWHTMAYW